MRSACAVLIALVFSLLGGGCTTKPYSFDNACHWERHCTAFYEDLHSLHVDIDRVFFDIFEGKDALDLTEQYRGWHTP